MTSTERRSCLQPTTSCHTNFKIRSEKEEQRIIYEDSVEDFLHRTVVANLSSDSHVTSMEFHPTQETLLLVGTNFGNISLWDVSSRQEIFHQRFKLWDINCFPRYFLISMIKEYSASVNRVVWSPNGQLIGIAFSKNIAQLYGYFGDSDIRCYLEIDAHKGSVNDLAFCCPKAELNLITCGEDKTIKIWDVLTGDKLYSFDGHKTPVHSLCTDYVNGILFVVSTSDGKIIKWSFDDKSKQQTEFDAPGQSCSYIAYGDKRRLFSCGTSKDNEPYILELNETSGALERSYLGLDTISDGFLQFDTAKNQFLAVGDESVIKYWDVDNINLLYTADAEGSLPASPCIRFSRNGSLLAVSKNVNGFKVLANWEGLWLLDSTPLKKSHIWRPAQIREKCQLRSLRLPFEFGQSNVKRLIYANSGKEMLSLGGDGINRLWKWDGMASSSVAPQLWQPPSGIRMTNDKMENTRVDDVHCFALNPVASHLVSASGGKISKFNLTTFEIISTFIPPPPAATSLAFHPREPLLAIGMEDSSILIFLHLFDTVHGQLRGHQKRITGLAFSDALNILVSSGADAQLCVWDTKKMEKKASTFLEIPARSSKMRIQFHQDQTQLLVVTDTKLKIFDLAKLECIHEWFHSSRRVIITDAAYSGDSKSVYACLNDGCIKVLTASELKVRCRINPEAYLPNHINLPEFDFGPRVPLDNFLKVYAIRIAANPCKDNQFAIVLSNGNVQVLEPLETNETWGTLPPQELGANPRRKLHLPKPKSEL